MTIAGDKPGAAQVLKLTNNILFAVALAATSEAFVMGAKGGLDPEVMVARSTPERPQRGDPNGDNRMRCWIARSATERRCIFW